MGAAVPARNGVPRPHAAAGVARDSLGARRELDLTRRSVSGVGLAIPWSKPRAARNTWDRYPVERNADAQLRGAARRRLDAGCARDAMLCGMHCRVRRP